MKPRIAFARALDILALAAIAFAVWKIFIAPRVLDSANAQPAPHASYARLDGGTFSIAEQRGHVVFLDFYATWCEPCKQELPLVERWASAHPGANVVPIDVGEPRSVASEFARKYSLSNVALDQHATAQPFFGVVGFPTIVVIDPQGRIRARWEGLNPAIDLALTNAQDKLAESQNIAPLR